MCTVQAGALAAARKELMDAQEKAKEVHEATLKLDSECDALRQQIASKDMELDRSAFPALFLRLHGCYREHSHLKRSGH